MIWIGDTITVAVLIAAVIWDLKYRKIPNSITLPAILIGLSLHLVLGGWGGLVDATKGMALGIALLFVPFALGSMGGGDVKLMGAVGSLQGVGILLHSAIYMGLAGGALCIIGLAVRGKFLFTFKRIFSVIAGRTIYSLMSCHPRLIKYRPAEPPPLSTTSSVTVPYGVAIGIGAGVALLTRSWPLW